MRRSSPSSSTSRGSLSALLWVFAVFALTFAAVPAAAGGSCSSSTDEFIHRYVTIPQKPLSTVLVQRFLGPELAIRCMSVTTVAGPSCPAAPIPTLCYRKASDTLAALTCEALPDFASDANTKVTRGGRDGPDMVWIVKLDTAGMPPSCFARTEEVRLMALVRGEAESSIALFVIFLIVVILVMLVVFAIIAFGCYQRYHQLDGAGAAAAAGPKMNYQGAQLNVAEPHVLEQKIERYLLPVRASGGTEDLAAYYEKIMNDPNYDPAVDGVVFDNGDLDMSRGPRSVRRITRASPPRPGDGEDDGRLAHHTAMRQMIADRSARRRRGNSRGGGYDGEGGAFDNYGGRRRRGRGGGDDDSDDDDYDFDDPRNLLDINDPNGGEIVYDAAGRPIGRRRRTNPNRRRGGRRGGDGQDLFPTQGGWSTYGGEDDSDDDDSDDDDGTGRPRRSRRSRRGGPPMPGDDLDAAGRSIKFIPRWMEGNFGRGGNIPEPTDMDEGGDPSHHYDSRMANPLEMLQITGGPNGGGAPLAQRLNKPPPMPNSGLYSGVGPTPVRQPSRRHDPLAGSPRGNSVRKGIVGGRTPGLRGPPEEEDYAPADGLGGGPNHRRSNSRGGPANGSFGGNPNDRNGLVGTPRGGSLAPNSNGYGYGRRSVGPDAFQRDGAKLHTTKLSLDANSYADPTSMAAMAGSRGGSRRGSLGGAGGGDGGGGADGGGVLRNADGTIISPYQCQDCGRMVSPVDPESTFCPATGHRHF